MFISKTTITVLAFAGGISLAAGAAQATTWYIDGGNCPGPGSGTEKDPFCLIQDGIDASISGDEVVVADGTYIGDGDRDLDRGLAGHGCGHGHVRALARGRAAGSGGALPAAEATGRVGGA